jgi:hypothetical protein
MKSKGHLVVFDANDNSILKVRVAGEKGPIRITEDQRNYVKLRTSVQRLTEHVANLDQRIQQIRAKITTALKDMNRPIAMQHLRQSKELEKIRLDQINSLSRLESILLRIENSHSDAEVFEAYKLGESTLRSMVSALPNISTIDDLMGALQESICDQEQISQAMYQQSVFENEDELLAELAMLNLPDAPTVASIPEDHGVSRLRDDMAHLALQTPPLGASEHQEDARTAKPILF